MDKNPDAPIELYNLAEDISESNNLASEYPEKANELKELMKNARTKSDIFLFDYEKE